MGLILAGCIVSPVKAQKADNHEALHFGGIGSTSYGTEIISVCIELGGSNVFVGVSRVSFCCMEMAVGWVDPFEENVVEGSPHKAAGTLPLADPSLSLEGEDE